MAAVCGRHLFFFLLLSLSLFTLPCFSQQSPANALLQLKSSFSNSDSLTNWKDDGSNPCDPNNVWVGIICADGVVSSINLSGRGLEGQPDIGALEVIDGLKAISIENNSFVGPMPQINRLRYLKAFYAGSNQFSGVIPSDFFQTLGSLKKLWLQRNKFSGQIPISIGELPNLKELHLEYNEFSGPIPAFSDPDIITKLDLSNNKLEGEIPKSLSQFDAKVFENNADLCGPQLDKECTAEDSNQQDADPTTGPKSSTKWIIMIVVVALLILIILAKANKIEEDDGRPSGKEPRVDEAIVNIPTIPKRTTSSSRKSYENLNNNTSTPTTAPPVVAAPTAPPVVATPTAPPVVPATTAPPIVAATTESSSSSNNDNNNNNNNNNNNTVVSSVNVKEKKDAPPRSSQRGATLPGASMGDLVMVNEERGVFGLHDLMKAAAEVLGNGVLGSAYKAMLGSGVSVVVKRVKEMNQMTKDVFDAEVRKLAKLKHQNILTPLAYHFRKEEKLLVSEYVPRGSLLYVLHGDRGNSHADLNWSNRLKIIKGVARGMGFLHSEFASYDLPHGNLKASNVLIGNDYEPVLSDYAFYPLVNQTPIAQSMFAFKSPEAMLNQKISPKNDVYCMGIIILEIITGKYPSQYFNNQKGGTDVVQWVRSALAEKREKELIDSEIASGAKESVGEMEKLLHIGAACTESEVDQRMEMDEAIRRIEAISV